MLEMASPPARFKATRPRAGRIRVAFKSEVKEIQASKIVVKTAAGVSDLRNDYLFVFAGAEMPTGFLKSLGIRIEKKFGEARRRT